MIDNLDEWLEEQEHEIMQFDGPEFKPIGIIERCGQPPLLCYDKDLVLEAFAQGFSEDHRAKRLDR